MKKIFYEKVGRRYVPVSEYDSDLLDALPKGTHIIMSYPGGKSTHYNIDPNFAAMIAAGRWAEDAICNAMINASELKPQRTPLTKEQLCAWRALAAAFGDDLCTLKGASVRECVEAGIKVMQDEANQLMQHPAVRDAYEQFQLVCKLTKEKQNGNS